MTTTTTLEIPGYVAGRWSIDPVHSVVSFTVRHLMVSKVRGQFGQFSGEIITAADPAGSSATATIDLTSIHTFNEQRDNHIRSADFLDVDTYPTMTYASTGVRHEGGRLVVDGNLTLKGLTGPVPLTIEVNGFGPDGSGGMVAGFTGTGELNRRDFGVNFNATLDGVGAVVGDKVTITLEVEALLHDA